MTLFLAHLLFLLAVCIASVDTLNENLVGNLKTKRRLPDAIIIGVKKGGTRALLEYLRINPQVKAPGPEVHFFDRHYERGLDWYRRQMPLASEEQTVIEKTPSYWVTREAPKRIHDMNPKVKLLVVVRHPITRALSDYAQAASKRPGMPSFEQMAFVDGDDGVRRVNATWGAIKLGLYERFTRRWLEYFPRQQIHFVYGERLINDPAREMAAVEKFLGLRHTIRRKNFVFDAQKGFPCILKGGTALNHQKTVRCLGRTKGRSHPTVTKETFQRLADFFAPHNRRFFALIGRTFPWRESPLTLTGKPNLTATLTGKSSGTV